MNIGERLSFNAKVMQFCLYQSGWSPKVDEEEAAQRYSDCVSHSIIAEQLFRA